MEGEVFELIGLFWLMFCLLFSRFCSCKDVCILEVVVVIRLCGIFIISMIIGIYKGVKYFVIKLK